MAGVAFVLMIAGGLMVLCVLVLVGLAFLASWRSPPDPRAGWRALSGVPVWFERAGQRFTVAEPRERFVLGAAGDCSIPGVRPRHAAVRVFTGEMVDIAPIDRAPLRVAGRRVRGATLVREGDRVSLGAVELVVHVGWLPDPSDPRIGSVVAGELLRERIDERRYASAGAVVEVFEPPIDPAAYEARLRAAQALAPKLLRVHRVEAGVLVVDRVEGRAQTGLLSPEQLFDVCRVLAPLHAAGVGHGGLERGLFVGPGRVRVWPVAPAGTVAGDLEVLRGFLPPDWSELPGADARELGLAVLRHGVATGAAFSSWDLAQCARCREPFAQRGNPETTMFDGFDPATGRRFGGRTTERRTECLSCGHVEVQRESECY